MTTLPAEQPHTPTVLPTYPGLTLELAGNDPSSLLVAGEIDTLTVPHLLSEASRVLRDQGALHLDLSGVTFFMGSAGSRCLEDLAQLAIDRGGWLTLQRPSRMVRRLLHLTGVDAVAARAAHPPG